MGFAVILAWYVEPLVFGVEFTGLLEDPAFSIGMISWFIGSVVDLAGHV